MAKLIISSYNPSQLSILVFLCSILTFHNLSPTKTTAELLNWCNCTRNITSAPKITSQPGLTTLLSSLSSKAESLTTEFYNTTSADSNNVETFHGLFMCSGDVTLHKCAKCVTKSTKKLASECPFSKEAVIWQPECLVRYSDKPFTTEENNSKFHAINREDYRGKLEQFYKVSKSLIEDLINQASDAPIGSRKFAVKREYIYCDRKVLYGLAQCTPNLAEHECWKCLKSGSDFLLQNPCVKGKIGARVMYPSCMVRYDPYLFYPHHLLQSKGLNLLPLNKIMEYKKEKVS